MTDLWRAFTDFFRFAPRRLSLCFLLMLFQSFSSGVGLMLLIPLLQLIGFDVAGGNSGGISESIGRFFNALGITLTLPVVLLIFLITY